MLSFSKFAYMVNIRIRISLPLKKPIVDIVQILRLPSTAVPPRGLAEDLLEARQHHLDHYQVSSNC